jgi:hypothetical protein
MPLLTHWSGSGMREGETPVIHPGRLDGDGPADAKPSPLRISSWATALIVLFKFASVWHQQDSMSSPYLTESRFQRACAWWLLCLPHPVSGPR